MGLKRREPSHQVCVTSHDCPLDTVAFYSLYLLVPGSFNENACWVPAVCRGPATQDKDILSAKEQGGLQPHECIAIFIEPTANQEIEIHHSDGDMKLQLKI